MARSRGLSQVVIEAVRERFDERDADRVIAALEELELPLGPPRGPWRDRIYLATLVLAGGEWRRFEKALEMARCDWRDLLVATGLEHANWPAVLQRLGFHLPYERY